MKVTYIKWKSIFSLGVTNLFRIGFYKIKVKFKIGINDSSYVRYSGDFINHDPYREKKLQLDKVILPSCLNWHKNYYTNTIARNDLPWFSIKDFNDDLGDIKGVWKASRFDWTLQFSKDFLMGDIYAKDKLNFWLNDWVSNNPTYYGVNWKCGQEASIRVMHLAFSAKLLSLVQSPPPDLIQLVKVHLQRIAPTISYAVAQDNNHGTSEAAALFIGGSWLVACGDRTALKWQNVGRKWLENRARHLIESDGSFSQYSVNYHRVMIDTYTMAELWRRELDLPSFSKVLNSRLDSAINWLYQLIQPENGDAPNLGHNDGALLLPLTSCDYRDFRPSIQLASIVFSKTSAWAVEGTYDEPLRWLGISKPIETREPPSSFHFGKGGYIGLRNNCKAFVLLNYPKFRFRPAQNDALHVDFWLDGTNLLRDGGTYSYNAGEDFIDYYGGARSHNTIQFDEHEQMPRLSRFLLGGWLKAKDILYDSKNLYCQASYKDYFGCLHKREVALTEGSLKVIDQINCVKDKAVLRWRLNPGNWVIEGNTVTNQVYTINIQSNINIKRFEIVEGRESRYYYQEASIPVLEVEVTSDGKIITEYSY